MAKLLEKRVKREYRCIEMRAFFESYTVLCGLKGSGLMGYDAIGCLFRVFLERRSMFQSSKCVIHEFSLVKPFIARSLP